MMIASVRALWGDAHCLRHVAIVTSNATTTETLLQVLTNTPLVENTVAAEAENHVTELQITPLVYRQSSTQKAYVINVINAFGEVICPSDLEAGIGLCDGVLVVVNADESGLSLLVETALKRATVDGKRVVLFINKMGKVLTKTAESLFPLLERIVSDVNVVIHAASDNDKTFQTSRISPEDGTVVFGSMIGNWGFTLPQFTAAYISKLDVDIFKMTEPLWDGEEQTFDRLVTDPLRKAVHASRAKETVKCQHILQTIGFQSNERVSSRLDTWLPLGRALLDIVVDHVPSPCASQANLVDSDVTKHDWATDVWHCRVQGALVAWVVKLVHSKETDQVLAIARVLSGKIAIKQDVTILSTRGTSDDYTQPTPFALDAIVNHKTQVQAVGIIAGDRVDSDVDVVPAGNLCVLYGVSDHIHRSGIVTTCQPSTISRSNFIQQIRTYHQKTRSMGVRVTVEPTIPNDHDHLLEGILWVTKFDPAIEGYVEDTGELTMSAISPRCLQRGLARLRHTLVANKTPLLFTISAPDVIYRETVTTTSPEVCMSRSPNRKVHLYASIQPLEDIQAYSLEVASQLPLERLKDRLHHSLNWSKRDVDNLVSGPQQRHCGSNVLVGQPTLRSCYYEYAGFRWGCAKGVLCGEPLFGIRLDLQMIGMFGVEMHWGQSQFIIAMVRLVLACELASSPALLQPVMMVEIQCRVEDNETCVAVLTARGACIVSQDVSKTTIRFHLRAKDCFDLDKALEDKRVSSILMVFSHYERVDGNPLDPETTAGRIVQAIRVRKCMKPVVPQLGPFQDAVQSGSVFFNPWTTV